MIAKEKWMPVHSYKMRCFLIAVLLTGIYLLENFPSLSFNKTAGFIYFIKPVLWAGAALIIWLFPRVRLKGLLRLKNFVYWWAFYFAILYLFLTIGFALLIDGFGKSPYDHSFAGIGINLFWVGALLISREMIRNYLVNSLSGEKSLFMMLWISLLMTMSATSLNRLLSLSGTEQVVKYLGEYFLPQFSHNVFASYLVLLGGPWASIIYLGTIQGFEWLCPILPDLKWLNKALIGVLYPIFSLMFFQNLYLQESKAAKKSRDEEKPLGWMLTCILSIGVIWFSVGVFPIYPVVILTGSMEPVIKAGDIVLIKRIADEELKIGEIIQFRRNGVSVCHRIVAVAEEEKQKRYITKGDNNTKEDSEWVKPEDIKGKAVYVIPKIGKLALFLRGKT
ncbi:MAG TPA: signal peptidase I [Clostridiales bacterium]|nr:signal peptidase I [Clostridiales bacterium]